MNENIVKDYLNGKSVYKISKETKFSQKSIKKYLVKHNIKIRTPEETRHIKLDANTIELLVSDYLNNLSQNIMFHQLPLGNI